MGYLERAGAVSLPFRRRLAASLPPGPSPWRLPAADSVDQRPLLVLPWLRLGVDARTGGRLLYFCGGRRAGGGGLPAAKPQPGVAGRHGLAGNESLCNPGGGGICRRAAGVFHPRQRALAGPRRRRGAVVARLASAGRSLRRLGRMDKERGDFVSCRCAGRTMHRGVAAKSRPAGVGPARPVAGRAPRRRWES